MTTEQSTQLFNGDSREVLRTLPDESVDMVMTSPPYYGLRSYKAESAIWDSQDGCRHQWGVDEHPAGYRKTDTHPGALQSIGTMNRDRIGSNFCALCGAWKGQLGSEPTPDLFIKHLCDIFDEVKRVLKKTGTAYINLDDSHQSSSRQCEPLHDKSDTIPQGCPLNDSIWNRPCDACQAASVLRTLHKDHSVYPKSSDGQPLPNPKHRVNQNARLPNDHSLHQSLPVKSLHESLVNNEDCVDEQSPDAQESTNPESFVQLPGECSPMVYSSSDQSKADSSVPYVAESSDGKNGNEATSSKSVYRRSGKVYGDNALFFSCPYYNTDAKLMYMMPPPKSLIGIPARFQLEMIKRGWICRNVLIWHKNSVMPESVKDRYTIDFERIFFFSKQQKYFFERQFEPYAECSIGRLTRAHTNYDPGYLTSGPQSLREGQIISRTEAESLASLGRNKRTTWTINPQGFKGPHYATYPEELCRTPIEASCPEFICTKCGKPRTKVYEAERVFQKSIRDDGDKNETFKNFDGLRWDTQTSLVGLSTCSCENPVYEPGTVLDPFSGTATTGVMAKKLGRKYIGIEISKVYHELAVKRIESTTARML